MQLGHCVGGKLWQYSLAALASGQMVSVLNVFHGSTAVSSPLIAHHEHLLSLQTMQALSSHVVQGFFTTMSGAVVSTFIGLWFGCVTLTLTSHRARLKAWACASILLFEMGVALHVSDTIPFNKNLCALATSPHCSWPCIRLALQSVDRAIPFSAL